MNTKILVGVVVIVIGLIAVTTSLIYNSNVERINSYEFIPEKPDDFDAYTRDIWSGALIELCDVGEEYWNQPEFYGESWGISKDAFYDNPDYSRWGVYGQGNIPKEISYSFTNLKKGDEFNLCTFFHNGFGIWTYQGFKLVPIQNEHFDVVITPNELTMSPTFPIFMNGWTQKINIKLVAKDNVPTGTYTLGFDVTEPSPEYAREETKRVLKLTTDKVEYKKECMRFLQNEDRCEYLVNNREKKYVNGGSYRTSEPLLKLMINVK